MPKLRFQSTWSVPRTFTGRALNEIAFPLGGIGTGTVSLGGRGQLRDWEVFNRPAKGNSLPNTFFAIRAQRAGEDPVARVLESRLQPPYGGAYGVTGQIAPGLPRLASATFTGAYPFATIEFGEPDLPVAVKLVAFNPMIPLNVEDSGLPVAVLRYTVSNPERRPARVSIVGSLQNAVGMAGEEPRCGSAPALGGNINEIVAERGLRGLKMRSMKHAPDSPAFGTMALATTCASVTCRREWPQKLWSMELVGFWDDFAGDGNLDDVEVHDPSPDGSSHTGSVCASVALKLGELKDLTFIIAWHFPNRTAGGCGWDTKEEGGGWIGNYYATRSADAWEAACHAATNLKRLEAQSTKYVETVCASTLPAPVIDAALSNVSTLRTQTCMQTADGEFHGFEGCGDGSGCCFGNCTHVWNYEYATAFLFPTLAQSLRRTEFGVSTLEDGLMAFRTRLPLGAEPWPHAAADGQMGCLMKLYRDWQLSGSGELLRSLWPSAKRALTFAWAPGGWDANCDGVMEGVQHHTLDVEMFGAHSFTGSWYLGALRATEEMARAVGDGFFAEECHRLFESGRAWMDANLFNGEYYVQKLMPPPENAEPRLYIGMGRGWAGEDTEFQFGNACHIDQLVGQLMAHLTRLGHLLDPKQQRKALKSLFKYNFKRTLFDHTGQQRIYALNDEAALLMMTWPKGDRPKVPCPYFTEAMTGFEYHAAVHMICEGMLKEGLEIIEAIRNRYDGERRNPWDEAECGHHYARAMASWAAIPALSGFFYSAPQATLAFAPRLNAKDFRCFWSVPTGWGRFTQRVSRHEQVSTIEVFYGGLEFRRLELESVRAVDPGLEVRVTAAGKKLPVRVEQKGQRLELLSQRPVRLSSRSASGSRLSVRWRAP